jgi:prevent-host-death family protein
MSHPVSSLFSASQSSTVTATDAKKDFGKILEKAIKGEVITITKHDAPKAVLISIDRLQALSNSPERQINTLRSEFEAMLADMQRPGARAAMQKAFDATPEQLGKAAVEGARRNKKRA